MTTYVKRLHRFFNVEDAKAVYAREKAIEPAAFDETIKGTVRVRRLYVEGLDWLLMDHLLSQYRHVPLLIHGEALAAGLQRPFAGLIDLYSVLMDLELLPPWSLNQTFVRRAPPEHALRFGELLQHAGIVSNVDLQRALGVQRIMQDKAAVKASIGLIFRGLGRLSIVDFFQTLAFQVGTPFEGLDESGPAIWDAASRRYRTIAPPPPST